MLRGVVKFWLVAAGAVALLALAGGVAVRTLTEHRNEWSRPVEEVFPEEPELQAQELRGEGGGGRAGGPPGRIVAAGGSVYVLRGRELLALDGKTLAVRARVELPAGRAPRAER